MEEQHYLHLPIAALTNGNNSSVIADTLTTTSSAIQCIQHDINELKLTQLAQSTYNQSVASKRDRIDSISSLNVF